MRRAALLSAFLLLAGVAACERVPLLAPAGSTITLTSASNALAANGTAQLTAQVLEAAGTPPHTGTHVVFTTTLGTIQPSTTETDVNGRAVAIFRAGNASGTATITASSGSASVSSANAVKIAVGMAAVGGLGLSASPATLPAAGGSSTLAARVIDINGNLLPGVFVGFTSDFGTINPSSSSTDDNGVASATLTTTRTSKVTATAGIGTAGTSGSTGTTAQSKDVTVTVNIGPTISLGSITSPAFAGQPVSVTVTITAPGATQSPVRSTVLQWGDGSQTAIGSSTTVATHVYSSPGTYTMTATATDTNGDSSQAFATVTVQSRPLPTVSISADTANPTAGSIVTFSVTVQPAAAATNSFIQNSHIDFGDGNGTDLGAQTGSGIKVPHQYTAPGLYTVVLTVTDSLGGQTNAQTQVIVK
jgi:adhesin/invasin